MQSGCQSSKCPKLQVTAHVCMSVNIYVCVVSLCTHAYICCVSCVHAFVCMWAVACLHICCVSCVCTASECLCGRRCGDSGGPPYIGAHAHNVRVCMRAVHPRPCSVRVCAVCLGPSASSHGSPCSWVLQNSCLGGSLWPLPIPLRRTEAALCSDALAQTRRAEPGGSRRELWLQS